MAGTVTGKVCVVDLQFQKSFTYWQCQSYRTYWQYQNLFRSCKNLTLNVNIKNNWKLQKTFSPMNMPSFVTAPTVASTTTWGRTSRWSCFRYSTCLKIFTSLSSSRSEAFCKSTGAGGEKRVGGGGVARRCSSTQPRSPFVYVDNHPWLFSCALRREVKYVMARNEVSVKRLTKNRYQLPWVSWLQCWTQPTCHWRDCLPRGLSGKKRWSALVFF